MRRCDGERESIHHAVSALWETNKGVSRDAACESGYFSLEENVNKIVLEPLGLSFSVCKVADYSGVDLEKPFVFTGSTDEEKSIVCPTDQVPENVLIREDGWRAFRISGVLEFSLIGILAGITRVLAERRIGVFVISTYNTDYVMTKEAAFEDAISALKGAGYTFVCA